MQTRLWFLPGDLNVREELSAPCGWSVFWYCYRCGQIYASARMLDEQPWKALGGCCPDCEGHKWIIPGSLENIMFIEWKVPLEIVRYQLECELRFTRSFHHPYNEKDDQCLS